MSAGSRGANRERQLAKKLEDEGWAVTRGAGSKGEADLWAAKLGFFVESGCDITNLRLIQVKTDKRGPFANFGPLARLELKDLAARTGGEPWLVHWPARGECRWIPPSDWPRDR